MDYEKWGGLPQQPSEGMQQQWSSVEGAPEFIPGLPVEAPPAPMMHGSTPGMGEAAASGEPTEAAAETPGAGDGAGAGGKKAEASATEDAGAVAVREGAEDPAEEGGKAEKQSESAATAGGGQGTPPKE